MIDDIAAVGVFFANLLLRPQAAPQVLAQLDDDLIADWPLPDRGATARGLEELRAALGDPETEESLAQDYARLFVGPGRMLACPYESVHRSEEGLTFEAQTLQVRAAYAAAGLQAPALNREPDDHVGLEFAFLGEVALGALNALEGGDQPRADELVGLARAFVGEHIASWVPGLAKLVQEHAETRFYRALGWLLEGAANDLPELLAAS